MSETRWRPEHLEAYTRPTSLELSTFLRGLGAGELSVFGVQCSCGERSLIVGVNFNWEVVDAGCGTCGHEFALYDPKVHGHLGWRGENDYERPPLEVTPNGCGSCRHFPHQIGVAVAYGPKAEAPADFSWMAIAGRCLNCSEIRLIIDIEAD